MKLDNYGVVTHEENGNTVHMFNGLPHYIGGPSIIKSNGDMMYHIQGYKYSEEDYKKKMAELFIERL